MFKLTDTQRQEPQQESHVGRLLVKRENKKFKPKKEKKKKHFDLVSKFTLEAF